VVALGHYQPRRVLDNDDLARLVDTSDAWIRRRVGIETRRIAGPEDTVDAMAAHAAAMALRNAGMKADEIDLVVVATCTAADRSPNMAARTARRLGARSPATLDVNTVCAGFTHALATVDHAISAGSARRALVIGAERFTDFTDWTDRTTCILTGDGAGAAVITASSRPAISRVVWGSAPDMGNAVVIGGPNGTFSQEGQTVFRWATTVLPSIARHVCEEAGVHPKDLAAVVLHQANLRIIEAIARAIGATGAVVAKDVTVSGNTSAASIPIALSKLVAGGEVEPGAPVLLFGFGGGLSYAGQVIAAPPAPPLAPGPAPAPRA
jgi:3-oxoacyl-[acyl-carrier-protein] synthase-3